MSKRPTTETITFDLCGHEMEDGRLYITSEALKGFHYVLEEGEEISAVSPAIRAFMGAYLKAEINKVKPAYSPKAYKQRGMNLNRSFHHIPFVAEVRNAIAA